jgi:C4-dicarboxylate-binding protein DctP
MHKRGIPEKSYSLPKKPRNILKRICMILCFSISFSSLFANSLPLIRISVENTSAHVQTQAVETFAKELGEKLSGRYEIQFYPSGSLFKDQEIFGALAKGKVEIAVPGTWQFDRYVPQVGLFLLPSFYGKDYRTTYELMDSPVGKEIETAIERTMGVKILGRWLDLGPTQIFSTTKPINTSSDISGKRIRVAGGKGNIYRIEALGGEAISIAWADLPFALSKNALDGLLTSYESVASARLWEYGIKQVYEDNQYFAQYVPIVASSFYSRLPEDVRQIILSTWESIVDQERVNARLAQALAREKLKSQKVVITKPSDEDLEKTRESLLQSESTIASSLGIDEETYALFHAYFQKIDQATREKAL